MAVSNGYPYPGFTNPYVRGKLPSVKTQRNRKMCAGRIFIFLILGVILFVLGLVSMGVYLNVNGSTSSSQYTEIMPLYITSGAVILAGMCVCVLFWKRLKALVFVSVIICVATGFLCGITAVLTCTHVLQPLQTFRTCRYYMSQKLCQCLSPYKRDMLTLEYSEKGKEV
ncbi:uncharacterized protein LOC123541702 [Mercenaria mercenaria]|uniref:uncharacterized protein LOC123541702 n=1 Tax=Mercenaria mercenaria TaxID=6596 RepID=UPI00234E6DB9|nr:uncharacterized protein LOC123541702 [Mercenaria mercenaria]